MGGHTLEELARHVGGRVVGDGSFVVRGVAPIDEAGGGDLTFIANPKYRKHAETTSAGALVVHSAEEAAGRNAIVIDNPYLALAKILEILIPETRPTAGISSMAYVDRTATVAEDACVFPFAYVGPGAQVGHRSALYPFVFVGEGASVGDDSVLYAGVCIQHGCKVGNRVILQPGVVIGGDGFGYAPDGVHYRKVPQVGRVVVDDDAEIGSNTTVDRGSVGHSRIGKGVKIDNLVQVGHNVEVGDDTVIVAQTAIAGSTKLGRSVQVGGQAAFVGHLKIGDRARIAARAGVSSDLEEGVTVGGSPHQPHAQWLRSCIVFSRLPEIQSAFRELQKKVEALEKRTPVPNGPKRGSTVRPRHARRKQAKRR
ncbi:MAG: UDP-3-O-(3-hydroxymyristoyl)glucosamine N-acyltransferase [Nitrospirae bacterium]|nr:UDP-3-O-(3-hydroxymyristoyl)glucosamine N-acyltransferase [Nitrospirota bacterium]